MKTKKILFYLLAGLLGGCIPVMSLHPLFTEKNIAYDAKLLGTWVDDSNETSWRFTDANEPEKAYKFIFTDKEGKKGSFIAYLVVLNKKLFLDVYPDESPWGTEDDTNKVKWVYNALFLMPIHTFIKINEIKPQLKLQLTDDDELKKLLSDDPNAVEHTIIEDRLILTASTKDLQAFVLKYADDDRVFTEEIVLTRGKNDGSDKPTKQKPEKVDPNKG
jgi:hypothetical protein